MRDAADLDARAVLPQAVRHLAFDGAVVALLVHVDEVDHDQAGEVAQPQLPRGLLLDKLTTDWLETAQALGCVAVIFNYRLWDENTVQLAKQAGLRTLSYTVNDEVSAQKLLELGTDGIITDRVELFHSMR